MKSPGGVPDRAAEKELQKLRRLPQNRICADCLLEDKDGLGHKDVCWKFKTFICSTCKSAHQSFSHRCKSVTMSNWTMEEVKALDSRNGGGNEAAGLQWLASITERDRPTKGDLESCKRFVENAYIKLLWLSASRSVTLYADPQEPQADTGVEDSAAREAQRDRQRDRSERRRRRRENREGSRGARRSPPQEELIGDFFCNVNGMSNASFATGSQLPPAADGWRQGHVVAQPAINAMCRQAPRPQRSQAPMLSPGSEMQHRGIMDYSNPWAVAVSAAVGVNMGHRCFHDASVPAVPWVHGGNFLRPPLPSPDPTNPWLAFVSTPTGFGAV
eukprot:CAMPEP_0170606026 /NCGR_PEP_ID=MMETSP0224-20130122/20287_1 /TAXON_ID=285029 /ORGANISM="Togula jolla, Strain CCCM 725" /LENGTH=329 /DNA_ID=CAMNT_0010931069 /DNA_START=44 /DNA_END=1030 /DNA_ORIENTATION=+